ncbi:MAG: cytochrome c biogenesis CcdA family protein, partial [Promethearchaeota archaeon]
MNWKNGAALAGLLAPVLLVIFASGTRASGQYTIRYYGDAACSLCHDKEAVIDTFVQDHPDVELVVYMLDFNNASDRAFHEAAFEAVGATPGLGAILNRSSTVTVLYLDDITAERLQAWYAGGSGGSGQMQATAWVAFLAGVLVGVSACMILLLSVIGTAITTIESRGKYAVVCLGLVLGLVSAYVVLGLLFVWFVEAFGVFTYFKYAFGAVLLVLGFWQVAEFRKEKSVVFGTPGKVKGVLREFIDRRSGVAAYLVGVVFALVKVPCFGGPFLAIVYDVNDNPLLFPY